VFGRCRLRLPWPAPGRRQYHERGDPARSSWRGNGSRGDRGSDLGRLPDRRQPLRPRSPPVEHPMMHSFPELTIDGVLVAPFVIYAGGAFAIFAVLRPFLRLVAFERAFSRPPIAELSLYVLVLALLTVVF